jgi:hypothetical protein
VPRPGPVFFKSRESREGATVLLIFSENPGAFETDRWSKMDSNSRATSLMASSAAVPLAAGLEPMPAAAYARV